ncbi:MAG: choice-of-anchor D domain-containing protein [Candidatus Acidiferrum sp.]
MVFSSGGAVAARNDETGALTSIAGSPFLTPANAPKSAFTIDVQGRFLFALGTNSIRMFQITDPTTGAYQEVTNSPFASQDTNQPAFIAVEPTGQYIAVVNQAGQNAGEGMVETFQIAPAAAGGPALIPVAGSEVELDSTAIGFAQPPDNKEFLIFMGPNPQSSNQTIQFGSEFQSLSIDPQSGFLTGYEQDAAFPQRGDSFAMDPQGRYYVTGTQDNLLESGSVQLFGITQLGLSGVIQLAFQNYPQALWVDSTGTFLYVAVSGVDVPVVINIYSVDLQTGALTETASSPLPGFSSIPVYYADPTGSFNYGFGSDQNTAIAYTVDPGTGYFIPTSNSPFSIPQIAGALTFSIPPGQQGISGPSASLSAANLSFGPIQTASSSSPRTVTLTSNGGQALSVNSISLGGADPSQFQEMDTCQIPSVLQPTKFCSISITFQPTDTGSQQAILSITDNAPDTPQSVTLTGVGVAPPPPAPAVTISPNPVSFAAITQGTTSSPIGVTVANSGNATLHISSIAVGGNNVSDFTTVTSGCSGAISAKAACTITVTFAPLAAGQRTETVTISDDATDSPQVINVGGSANPAIVAGPAPNGSTSASISAGQTAQFNLQMTPGPGYTGVVSFSCSGAPLGAACQVPASVQVSNGSAASFTVMVVTSGGASENLPYFNVPRPMPIPVVLLAEALSGGMLLLLVLLFVPSPRRDWLTPRRLVVSRTFAVVFLLAMLGAITNTVGCGGGSQLTTAPPQITTPQGTTTITVTPSAASTTGQQLQLQPIQLTLTVH